MALCFTKYMNTMNILPWNLYAHFLWFSHIILSLPCESVSKHCQLYQQNPQSVSERRKFAKHIYRDFSLFAFPSYFFSRSVDDEFTFFRMKMLLRTLVQSHYKHIIGIHSLCSASQPVRCFSYIGPLLALMVYSQCICVCGNSVRQHKTRYKSYGKINQEIHSSNKNMK